ncbi:MAG: tetratricopeptide repeat-containing protein, partial [Candidatus Omnitrophica bacterium]|nr:tetratricopeptide repeat-containing protein [Candidatus Omnitrophota bacterium]
MTKRKKHLRTVEPVAAEDADAISPNRSIKFLWILPLLAALFFNLSVLDNGFVWDDYNLFERQLPAIKTVKDAFFPGEKVPGLFGMQYFRPFTLLSYKADKALWGHNVKGYHFNVLLSHCLNTVLVYFLALLAASRLRSKYSIALFSAALFAVHPVHAEVVAWICGRNESLSTNFALLAVVLFALCRKKDSMLWLSLSCLCFLIGLFFKELAAAVLFLIPLYDLCFYRKNYSPLTKKNENVSVYALFAATFFLYYIVRKMSLGGFGLQSFIEEMNLVKAVISTLGYYLKVTVLPLELDYFISEIPSSNIYFLCSALALAGLLFIAVKSFFDDKRIVTFGILSFLVILAPSLAVAITYISETPLALRYLYFPSVGFVILLGYLLRVDRIGFSSKVPFGQKIKCALFLFIFIFYQYVNAGQILIWKDDISLWSSVTQKTPEAGLPHSELGRAYILAGRPQEAIEEYKKALAMKYDNEGKS